MTMSEIFHSTEHSDDNSFERLQSEMMEPCFVEMNHLLQETQYEYDDAEDDIECAEAIDEVRESIARRYKERFDQALVCSAVVRPFELDDEEDVGEQLSMLTLEGEPGESRKVLQDELGPYVVVSAAEDFSLYDIGPVSTEQGEKLGYILRHDSQVLFAMLPNEIFSTSGGEVDITDQEDQMEKFYPTVATRIETLHGVEDEVDLIAVLNEMEIIIPAHELRETPEDAAHRFGAYATEIAMLDTAAHRLTHNGTYRIENSLGDMRENDTLGDQVQYGDLHSINFAVFEEENGTYAFVPELTMVVGLPGRGSNYGLLHIPATNIEGLDNLRAGQDELFSDEVYINTERLVGRTEDHFEFDMPPHSSATPQPELAGFAMVDRHEADAAFAAEDFEVDETFEYDTVETFEQYRERLVQTQASMDLIYKTAIVADNLAHESKNAYLSSFTGCIDSLENIGTDTSLLWTYTGDGVRNVETAKYGNSDAMAQKIYGHFEGAQYRLYEVVDEEGKDAVVVRMLMTFNEPATDPTIEVQSSLHVTEDQELNLEVKQTSTLRRSVAELGLLEEAPRLVDLQDITRRQEAVEKAHSLFADDAVATDAIERFADAFNQRYVTPDVVATDVPIEELKAVAKTLAETAPETKHKLAEVMALCLPSNGMQQCYVFSNDVLYADTKERVEHENFHDVQLLGIEYAEIEGVHGKDMPLFVADKSGRRVYIPLAYVDAMMLAELYRTNI